MSVFLLFVFLFFCEVPQGSVLGPFLFRKTCYSFFFYISPALPVCYTFQCLCSSLSIFSLLLSWYVFLGVGQRGVVVYHGLVWVRAAVVRPAERAAETPALCAPSRRSVSNHGSHFIYQDQSASIQQGPKMTRQNHAMLKTDTCLPSRHLKLEVKLLHTLLFASTFLQLPTRNVCTVIHSTASTL